MTEDPQADAGERTRSAHRAIEIREKRRRVLSSCPAWITLRGSPFHLIGDGRVPAQLVQAAATGAAAVAAGWWEHGAAVAEQHAQRSVHLVTAVLLQDVPDIVVGTGTWNAGALARWTASDGKSRVGVVLDTAGAKAGSTLPIWVDGSGRADRPAADPPRGAVTGDHCRRADLGGVRDHAAVRGHLAEVVAQPPPSKPMPGNTIPWPATRPRHTRNEACMKPGPLDPDVRSVKGAAARAPRLGPDPIRNREAPRRGPSLAFR